MNHTFHILQAWYPAKDDTDWVLALISSTQGSSYRKAGAMMLIGGQGQALGIVSGGCLEGDLKVKALRVMQTGEPLTATYDLDASDEPGWQPAIGCGGRIDITLFPVSRDNDYLKLDQALEYFNSKTNAFWTIDPQLSVQFVGEREQVDGKALFIPLVAPIHLLILGGGIDAIPVAETAARLGWQVTVNDARTAYGRQEFFPSVCVRDYHLADFPLAELLEHDAVVVMHHNLEMDAAGLSLLRHSQTKYIGLLGPEHRKQKVMAMAEVTSEILPCPVAGPIGLDLGGDLPESIALSMLAEIQAVYHGKTAQSHSGLFV